MSSVGLPDIFFSSTLSNMCCQNLFLTNPFIKGSKFLDSLLISSLPTITPMISVLQCRLSDHRPVSLTFPRTTSVSNRATIPRWIAENPSFAVTVRSLWDRNRTKPNSAYKKISFLKDIMVQAAKRVTKTSRPPQASHLIPLYIKLLRLLLPVEQDDTRIDNLLALHPQIRSLVSFSEGRWGLIKGYSTPTET